MFDEELENLKALGLAQKYEHPGIYSISINEKIVYIGKSRDMLVRLAQHITNIKYDLDKCNKYQVLRQAHNRGIVIEFDVQYVSKKQNQDEIDRDIGEREAELINQYAPVLNYQLPLLEDYKHFKVNKKAKTITLDEILGNRVFVF